MSAQNIDIEQQESAETAISIDSETSASFNTDKNSEFETYEEIVRGHLYPVYNYQKRSPCCEDYEKHFQNGTLDEHVQELKELNKRRRKTANSLFSNELSKYGIFDADLKHGLSNEEVKRIHDIIYSKIPEDVNKTIKVIEETGNHGLHIPCINDVPELFDHNRYDKLKKWSVDEPYEIDIFVGVVPKSPSQVLVEGSRIRKDDGSIGYYTFARGNWQSEISVKLSDLMRVFNVYPKPKTTVNASQLPFSKSSTYTQDDNNERFEITRKLQEKVLDTLPKLASKLRLEFETIKSSTKDNYDPKKLPCIIHHTASSIPFIERPVMVTIIECLNNFDEDIRASAIDIFSKHFILSDNVKRKLETIIQERRKFNPYILFNFLLYYVPDEITEKEIHDGCKLVTDIVKNEFDYHDGFSSKDIMERYERGLYFNYEQVVNDMLKIWRVIDRTPKYAIKKTYNADDKVWVIESYKYSDFVSEIRGINIIERYTKKKTIHVLTAYDAYLKHQSVFYKLDIVFYDTCTDYLSIFHGWKWIYDGIKFDYDKMKKWIEFIYVVICNYQDDKFLYILKWIAFIAQKKGELTQVSPLLLGDKGVGKNTFTDQIAIIFDGYSNPNLNDLSEITGDFNGGLENLVFACFNEIKKASGRNKIKAYITEKKVRVRRLYKNAKMARNTCNIIFNTNDIAPFTIETGDRRVVVFNCNSEYKCEHDYWKELYETFNEEFYSQFLYFLMNVNIEGYRFQENIPKSSLPDKRDLINACGNKFDKFIRENYEAFINGIQASVLKELINTFNELYIKRGLMEMIVDYDELRSYFNGHGIVYKNKKFNGSPKHVFVLVDEVYKNQYKPDDAPIVVDEETIEPNKHKIDNVELQEHVKTIALSLFKKTDEELTCDETDEISIYDD